MEWEHRVRWAGSGMGKCREGNKARGEGHGHPWYSGAQSYYMTVIEL